MKKNGSSGGASAGSEVESKYERKTFGLQVFNETMELVDCLFQKDNCRSRSQFIEKAIRFYCGYVMGKEKASLTFLAPQILSLTEGVVKGSEQRLARAIFKLAVEVGVQTHLLAAINDLDDTALFKMRSAVTDEVRRINGIINFESAVREQRS